MKNRKFILFSVLAALLLLTAVFAEYLCPYDPDLQNLLEAQQAPSLKHIMGTDRFGRDLFSRVLMGGRTSIFASLLLVVIVTVVGTLIGILCGWRGGWIDNLLMRISDVFLAFPGLVFALAVAGVLGGGIWNAMIALAAIGWPKFARLARSLTLSQKESTYLQAAKLAGDTSFQMIRRHLLPNIAGSILVTSLLDIGTMMMELAGLSFLGLGVKPPMAEWGSMMNDGRNLLQIAPWISLAPGAAILITVMIFNLFGDSVRDVLDSKQKKGRKEK